MLLFFYFIKRVSRCNTPFILADSSNSTPLPYCAVRFRLTEKSPPPNHQQHTRCSCRPPPPDDHTGTMTTGCHLLLDGCPQIIPYLLFVGVQPVKYLFGPILFHNVAW